MARSLSIACCAGVCAGVARRRRRRRRAGQQVYRYVDKDGRVVYSDRAPPPATRRTCRPKRLGANFIETSEPPLAAQQATERYPVTLYTFACGELCQNAEALLNRRGVPFTTRQRRGPARTRSS